MEITLKSSSISGGLIAPSSKSVMQRAVAASLLAEGISTLHFQTLSDDVFASLNIIKNLGATYEISEGKVEITGGFHPISSGINCGESGLSTRLFTPIACLHTESLTINGRGSLQVRPISMMEVPLRQLGVDFTSNKGFLPINVKGRIRASEIRLDGSVGSQFLTGLLMTLPKVEGSSILNVNDLKSKPYVDLTLQVLRDFGVNIENENYEKFKIRGGQKYIPQNYTIEGDWSSISCLLVAGALNGKVEISRMNLHSTQADIKIIDVLKEVGAIVKTEKDRVTVEKNILGPFHFDATDCPDLFPALVALAAHCKGTTILKGVKRLKHKESDRATVLKEEFYKLGIKVEIDNNKMLIEGGTIRRATVSSHNDHRIAMALATVSLLSQYPITIEGVECVAKSYPNFFEDLNKIKNIE